MIIGIQITAFQSLGGQSLVELGMNFDNMEPLLKHETVSKIASKHGKSTAQVLFRWSLERNTAIIPKSNNMNRLRENLSVSDFKLDSNDMEELSKMDKNFHFNDPKDFADTPIWH